LEFEAGVISALFQQSESAFARRGDYAMKEDTTKAPVDMADEKLFDNWFDPIEMELRTKVRGFIEAMIEEKLETALARPRYGRRSGLPAEDDGAPIAGHRHGRRTRRLTGTFGATETFPAPGAGRVRRPGGPLPPLTGC
jgi:hypothetical protein